MGRLSSGALTASGRTGGLLAAQMVAQHAIRLTSMRDVVFLFGRHLRERLCRSMRLEPRVPSELLFAARLDENFPVALAEKNLRFVAVPIRDAALRFRRSIEQRVCDRARRILNRSLAGTRARRR